MSLNKPLRTVLFVTLIGNPRFGDDFGGGEADQPFTRDGVKFTIGFGEGIPHITAGNGGGPMQHLGGFGGLLNMGHPFDGDKGVRRLLISPCTTSAAEFE